MGKLKQERRYGGNIAINGAKDIFETNMAFIHFIISFLYNIHSEMLLYHERGIMKLSLIY